MAWTNPGEHLYPPRQRTQAGFRDPREVVRGLAIEDAIEASRATSRSARIGHDSPFPSARPSGIAFHVKRGSRHRPRQTCRRGQTVSRETRQPHRVVVESLKRHAPRGTRRHKRQSEHPPFSARSPSREIVEYRQDRIPGLPSVHPNNDQSRNAWPCRPPHCQATRGSGDSCGPIADSTGMRTAHRRTAILHGVQAGEWPVTLRFSAAPRVLAITDREQ